MNEAQVNEPQADDGVDEETLASSSGDVDAEKLRRLRLTGFLRELVREEGRVEAAELLGVAYRTVVRAEGVGRDHGAHGRCAGAAAGDGRRPPKWPGCGSVLMRWRAAWRRWRRSCGTASARFGLRLLATPSLRARARRRTGSPTPGRAGRRPGLPLRWRGCARRSLSPSGRLDPQVVTEEACPTTTRRSTETAWPLVEEWRRLRADHPHQGKSLSWLTTEERLLVLELELAMLEDHGLTLPPEKQPLRGFGAQGPDHPPLGGAGRHTGGVAEAKAAALGAPGPHPVAVAEVGPGDGSGPGFRLLLPRSEMGANSARVIWVRVGPKPPPKPSIRSVVLGDN